MSITINFEQIVALYIETARSIRDPGEYLESAEYQEAHQLAKIVFDEVKPLCYVFFGLVKGLTNSSELLRWPNYSKVMCFPERFLKRPSITHLPQSLRATLDAILEGSFFLGLLFHLFSWRQPTRAEKEKVNMQELHNRWIPETLVADTRMKQYNQEFHGIPKLLFTSYYDAYIHPALKEQFGLGFWTRAKCRSYFGNLFFSGARLGMVWDVSTAEEPLGEDN